MTRKYLLAVLTALAATAIFAANAFAMYDAPTGRWLQRDPLAYVDGMNLYEYVQSSPTQSIDYAGTDDSATKQSKEQDKEQNAEVIRKGKLEFPGGEGPGPKPDPAGVHFDQQSLPQGDPAPQPTTTWEPPCGCPKLDSNCDKVYPIKRTEGVHSFCVRIEKRTIDIRIDNYHVREAHQRRTMVRTCVEGTPHWSYDHWEWTTGEWITDSMGTIKPDTAIGTAIVEWALGL